MKKRTSILTAIALALSLGGSVINAAVPPADADHQLYANKVIEIGDYKKTIDHVDREYPENALDKNNATQGGGDDKFYSVASHTYTTYAFGKIEYDSDGKIIAGPSKPFYNVANYGSEADILLCEVTWGTGNDPWHVEAAKVYLKSAYVRNDAGEVVPYVAPEENADEVEYGYYAGIAWNKVGQQKVDATRKAEIEKAGYEDRGFVENYFKEEGNFQWTGINLPAEVVYAEGVTLVDITAEVNDDSNTEYYAGYQSKSHPYKEGHGGYDLDAIRVYSADPMLSFEDAGGDSATGLGTRIKNKGTWFMYNEYDANAEDGIEGEDYYINEAGQLVHKFDIVAGNPKNGENIIGYYTVTNNGDGTYTVDEHLPDTIEIDGYKYKLVVTDKHLAIENDNVFTAAPGKDANKDFGDSFAIEGVTEDGEFNIFAHFAVEYKAYIGAGDHIEEPAEDQTEQPVQDQPEAE